MRHLVLVRCHFMHEMITIGRNSMCRSGLLGYTRVLKDFTINAFFTSYNFFLRATMEATLAACNGKALDQLAFSREIGRAHV